jgi:hypothetical protein
MKRSHKPAPALFCRRCGKRTIPWPLLGEFSPVNGKQIMVARCPSAVCTHTGFDHTFVQRPGLFGAWRPLVCSRCRVSLADVLSAKS